MDASHSAVRLKAARQQLSEFIRSTGGRADSARTGVAGFGRSAAGKATWAAKKAAQKASTYFDRVFKVYPPSPDKVSFAMWNNITERQAKNLQRSLKTLLQRILEIGDEYEAGGFLDANFNLLEPKSGSKGKVTLSAHPEGAIGTAHTHPSNETFSLKDFSNFTTDVDASIMVVVGNNGAVYILEKSADADFSGMYRLLQEKIAKTPDYESSADSYVAFMEEFLHEIELFGYSYFDFGASHNT